MLQQLLGRVCVGACLALAPALALAQSATTGAIAGIARDTTGAVLPGVTVEAASPALIEKVRVAVSDDQGNYKIIDLRPGTYTVTFTLPGFATYKRDGVEVVTGVTAAVNGDMRVGALEETVTVTGASPVVDVQNVRSQNVLSHEVLDTMPAAKTLMGFATLTLGAMATGRNGGPPVADVGGSKGDSSAGIAIHGMRPGDQRQTYDGMSTNNLNAGGGGRSYLINQVAVQEVVLGTGSASAETETGGISMNMVPKDGGNIFKYYFVGAYTNDTLQKDNIDDAIRRQGVSAVPGVKQIYDWGVGVGGPIVKDKLWFYSADRWWGAAEYQPGSFFNKSTSPLFYVQDPDRPGYTNGYAWDIGVRATWQALPKHKFTMSENYQHGCQCYQQVSATIAPESAFNVDYGPLHLVQGTWSYPASNRLLFDAGISYGRFRFIAKSEDIFPDAIRIQELSTGFQYGSNAMGCCAAGNGLGPWINDPVQQRAAASYVIGSHAFRVGQSLLEGFFDRSQNVNQALWYSFNNGRPSSITQWAMPSFAKIRVRGLGLYAQDQWTMNRLTLNLGLRYDNFQSWIPAGTRPATRFVPEFSYAQVDGVPNFKDVSPRIGGAYDVFGDGRTAIKASLGRYVAGLGTDFAEQNHPALNIVRSTTRTWNDANGNFVPDCTLTVFTANGECAALANSQFGRPLQNTFYAEDALNGFRNRGYSWQGTVALQQQLLPGVALNVGYFRTSYSNITVTDNELVTPADFQTYCVTAPVDARLPGGGGNQLCGLYDVTRAKFGQVRSLVTQASGFGKQVEKYDGVDVGVNARFGKGGLLQGGASFGRQVTDNCFVVDSPQQAREGFCNSTPPWSAGTQFKFNGVYPLPWGIEPSFTFQNLPGTVVAANWAAPNASIAPSLGRNLSACAAATGACTSTATVALVPAATMFLDRITQIDLRLTKVVKLGNGRVKGMFDIYNLGNANTILAVNTTYGPAWLRPTSILGGRLFKFGAQVDF